MTDAIFQTYIRQTEKFARELLVIANQHDKTIEDLSQLVHDFYQTMREKFENGTLMSSQYHNTSGIGLISSSLSAAAAAAASVTSQASRASPIRLVSNQLSNSNSSSQLNKNDKNKHVASNVVSDEDQWETLSDIIEQVLNDHIYQDISARIINEDEEQIIAFQRRIRSLNWITVEHLDINIDFKQPSVHDLLDKAICQMIEMNSRTSSLDKLHCIVECSKSVLELLQLQPGDGSRSTPVSADVFLPVVVFVVIQANPPMLPVDMKYINKFTNPNRLERGEAAYYFTQLSSAMQFIETINGPLLNISEEDFNKFVRGEAIPETKSQFSTYLCDGLRTICSNEATLKELKAHREVRQSNLSILFEKIDVHLETNKAKLREVHLFAANLKKKLRPNFPKFYTDLIAQNEDLAHKLLPNYLRPSMESKRDLDAKLVDFGEPKLTDDGVFLELPGTRPADEQANSSEADVGDHPDKLISKSQLLPAWTPKGDDSIGSGTSSMSPIEKLEQDISRLLELPDPIQPEAIVPVSSERATPTSDNLPESTATSKTTKMASPTTTTTTPTTTTATESPVVLAGSTK